MKGLHYNEGIPSGAPTVEFSNQSKILENVMKYGTAEVRKSYVRQQKERDRVQAARKENPYAWKKTKPSEPKQKPVEPVQVRTPAPPKPAPEVIEMSAWVDVRSDMNDAIGVIGSYEIDTSKAIDYPAFNDLNVPEVQTMIRALKKARRFHDRVRWNSKTPGTVDLYHSFADAVDELSTTISIAERTAQKIQWSLMDASERKDLKAARSLLAHASDPANTPEARATYYGQLQKVVRRLNEKHGAPVVPEKALTSIEQAARLALDSLTNLHINAEGTQNRRDSFYSTSPAR